MRNVCKVCLVSIIFISIFIFFSVGSVFAGGTQESSTEPTVELESEGGVSSVEAPSLVYDTNKEVNNGKPITVTFWQLPQWQKYFEPLAADYSKIHPNVKFDFTWISYGDITNKLPLAMSSGSGPDIFYTQSALQPTFLNHEEPFPEDVIPLDEYKTKFRGVEESLINGKIYYLNIGLMSSMIFYNTKMWNEAGLSDEDIPKSWDQLIEVAKKLTTTSSGGKINRAGINLNGMEYLVQDLIYQQGYYLFAKDKKTPIINAPEVVKSVKMFRDMYSVHKICDVEMPDAHTAFGNKQAAMIYGWGWVNIYFKNNFSDVSFSAFPLPSFDGKTPPARARNNLEGLYAISNKASSEAKAVGFDFVKFNLNNDGWIARFCSDDGITPSKYTVDTRPEILADPVVQLMVKYSDRTIFPGIVPQTYFSTFIDEGIHQNIMLGNEPIEKTLDETEKKLIENMKGLYINIVEDKYKYAEEMSYIK